MAGVIHAMRRKIFQQWTFTRPCVDVVCRDRGWFQATRDCSEVSRGLATLSYAQAGIRRVLDCDEVHDIQDAINACDPAVVKYCGPEVKRMMELARVHGLSASARPLHVLPPFDAPSSVEDYLPNPKWDGTVVCLHNVCPASMFGVIPTREVVYSWWYRGEHLPDAVFIVVLEYLGMTRFVECGDDDEPRN